MQLPSARGVLLGTLLLGVCGFCQAVIAATYDLSLDFSASSNPNGVWSYGNGVFDTNSEVVFNPFDTGGPASYGASSLTGWTMAGLSTFHTVSKNTSGSTLVITNILTLAPGEMVMHPYSDGKYSIVRWTAPGSGSYQVDALFSLLDPTHGSTDIRLAVNGLELLSETDIITNFGDSTAMDQELLLAGGDTLDFMVGYNGTWVDDSTKPSITIEQLTSVPLPSALWLFLSGLITLSVIKRGR